MSRRANGYFSAPPPSRLTPASRFPDDSVTLEQTDADEEGASTGDEGLMETRHRSKFRTEIKELQHRSKQNASLRRLWERSRHTSAF